jgi:cytochrome c oxidase subunit 4
MSSSRLLTPLTYLLVLVALVALTFLTVGISLFEISGRWHLAFGLAIGLVKAVLVLLFFMHVIHSSAATKGVLVFSVFWLVVVLICLTMADYTTRGLVPFTPGH